MSAHSRTKGAAFERDVARALDLLTGIRFERNLEQVRTVDQGDLIPSDPAFPFLIECKRYGAGVTCLAAWKAQASRAAVSVGKIPAVVFRFDRQPVRVALPLAAICDGRTDAPAEWAEISLDGLAYVAREIMATKVLT